MSLGFPPTTRRDQTARNQQSGLCVHYQLSEQCSNGGVGIGGSHTESMLPPSACCTLIVKGLPTNCTQREASRIFSPFHGYRNLKLWTAESSEPSGGLVTPCVVYFERPEHAAAAMYERQGYKLDLGDGNLFCLKLQFFCAAAREGTSDMWPCIVSNLCIDAYLSIDETSLLELPVLGNPGSEVNEPWREDLVAPCHAGMLRLR